MRRITRIRRGLLRWLSTSETPVFVLDERRVVLFFNHGCEECTGWQAADVIGRTCDFTTGADPQSVDGLTGRICPPPEVFAGEVRRVAAELVHRDGQLHRRTIHYFPLTGIDGAPLRILGLISGPEEPAPSEPLAPDRLHLQLAAMHSALARQNCDLALVGTSSTARRLCEQVRIAAASGGTTFLHGERGTGRQWIARLIHQRSERKQCAFVPLDCRHTPPFEIKRALRRLFESSAELPDDEVLQPGTVYLQSAGSLPRDLQEFLVSAGEPPRRWQLISSDERPLAALLEQEQLLPAYVDLLAQITIDIPPLRARREDLPLLAQHLLEELNRGQAKQVGGFSDEVWDLFHKYEWPGNVAELSAVIREAREVCAAPLITPRDLPFRFRTGLDAQTVGPSRVPEPVSLEEILAKVEADHIRWALSVSKSNKSQAAALLGLTRPRLYRRMEALGIADPGDASE